MDLSLVVITRNEEKCLERCVRSVPFADEVIVVDSGSTDSTVELAGALGCRVIHHDFQGYSKQKQWALEQAACSWVLSLDADEYLTPSLAGEIEVVLSRSPSHSGFRLPFRMLYMGRLMRFGPWSGERHLRLFRKDSAVFDPASVHEAPSLSKGSIGDLRGGYVVHESYDSIGEQVGKMMLYAGLWADEQFEAGRGSGYFRIAFRPVWRFFSGYFLRGGFLEGVPGLAASGISAWYVLMKWLLLHERRRES
jgi:glycosyltransferase involved in cell wall biosynthesis